MRDEPDIPIADQDWLDWAFDFAIAQLERGQAVRADELLDGHEHLLTEVQRLLEVARQLAVGPAAALPTLHGYTLLRELGRGGMGVVYLAKQERVAGRPVALKILPQGVATSSRARERFRGEAEAIAGVRHPNVVSIHDVIHEEGVLAYAMEWVEGKSLGELIAWLRQFPSPSTGSRGSSGSAVTMADLRGFLNMSADAAGGATVTTFICRIAIAVARGLSAVHAAGLVHRDVKPSNILLRRDGTPLLSDFGLARETDATLSEPGHFVGTMAYAPPEQLRGESGAIDARSDVYALGVTLYHVLALRLPFGKRATKRRSHEATKGEEAATHSPTLMLRLIESGAGTPLRKVNPRLPRDLETIVAKAMDAEPTRRYQTADELADDLERLLSFKPIRAKRAGLATRLAKLVRRNRAAAWGVTLGSAVSLTLAAALVVYVFFVPGWVAGHVREARLALLSPDHANNIISVLVWDQVHRYGSAAWEERRRDFGHALTEYDAAIRLSPFDDELRRERAIVAAAREGKAGSWDDPRSTGLFAFLTQEYETALKDWARYEQTRDPIAQPDPLVDAALGILYLFDDQAPRAYPRLQKAVEAFPNIGFLMEYLADAAAKCGDAQRARRWLEESKHMPRRDELGAAGRINAGVLAAEGRTAEAIEAYQKVSPKEVAGIELAKLLEREGRLHEAATQYTRLMPTVSIAPRVRAAFTACADRWWASQSARQRLRRIRRSLDEPPHPSESFVGLLRRYSEATKPRSHEDTEPRRHGATEPRSHGGRTGESDGNQNVSGPDRLAESERPGQGGLSQYKENARRREVRPDFADAQGGRLDSVEHRRGPRQTEPAGLPQISEDRSRLPYGTPDSIDSRGGTWIPDGIAGPGGPPSRDRPGASRPDPKPGELERLGSPKPPWLGSFVAPWLLPGPPPLRGFVASWLRGFSWPLGPINSSPSLQSLSLSELAQRMEVQDMSLWNRIPSYPRILKELQFAAWRWGMLRNISRAAASVFDAFTAEHERRLRLSRRAVIAGATIVVGALASQPANSQCTTPPCFQGLGDLPGGAVHSEVYGLSHDGITVVGQSSSQNGLEAFRWTPGTGIVGLGDAAGGAFFSYGYDASGDGSVIVGQCETASGREGFRWTAAEGIIPLGDLPGGGVDTYAFCVSPDGTVIGGESLASAGYEAFHWSAASGLVSLGDFSGGGHGSTTHGISGDGSVLIGNGSSAQGGEAFRWTETDGLIGLGDIPGDNFDSVLFEVTGDGLMAVGRTRPFLGGAGLDRAIRWRSGTGLELMGDLPGGVEDSYAIDITAGGEFASGYGTSDVGIEAVIWDSSNNISRVSDVLLNAGATIPSGWILRYASGIALSGNVVTVAGNGTNPNGNPEAWIARYALPPACEAPQVSQHPQSATIAAGANANFTVVATGTATLSYQWRKNTVNLNNGASGCSSTISGATTASLTISNVSITDNAAYDCVVTNACGSDTSDPATLTVPAGPACAGDMDGNNMVDGNDIDEFVAKLLAGGVCS